MYFKMPATKDKRKLYKCVKKTFDGVDYLTIKYRNLDRQDIKEVRDEINELLKDFWKPLEEVEDEDAEIC